VKVSSIVEMLNVSPTSSRPASQEQVSDQSRQTFKESLLAVSRALPGVGAANEPGTGHLQKSVSEASKLPSTVPNVRAGQLSAPPLQIVPQQLPVAQQRPLINPALLSMQFSVVEPILSARTSTVVADRPAPAVSPARFSVLAVNLPQPEGAEPDSVTSSHARKESDLPQVASILPSGAHLPLIVTDVSSPIVNPVPSALLSMVPGYPANAAPKADAGVVADAVPSVLPDVVQKLTPNSIASSLPSLLPDVVQKLTPDSSPSSVPSVLPNIVQKLIPDSIPSLVASAVQNIVPSPVTSDASNFLPRTVMSTVTIAYAGAAISPDSSPLPSLPPTVILSAVPGAIPGSIPSVVEHSASPVGRNAVPNASLNAFPVSALHGIFNPSPKGDIGPKSSPVPISGTNPPAASGPSELTTSPNLPDATANQLLEVLQPGGVLLATVQASTSPVSSAAVAKPATTAVANGAVGADAINDVTGLKQHAQSVSDTSSQETAPSGDQSQSAPSQQGQSVAPAQNGSVSHTIAGGDHAPDAVVTPPLQTAPSLVGVAAHAAKTSGTAAPATIVLPQAASVINTAKLIQSIGQTEMRVGLRSNDFGNISISTSATRDLISAQISLDHGELARTLAVHLPEMQARFGGAQVMDVRIDMNGQATGQGGAGIQANMSDGSAAGGSRGERQQKGSVASSQSSDSFAGPGNSIAVAAMTSGEGRLNGGLDIRI
jgi:hypothetical protein